MARQNIFFCNGVRISCTTDLYDNFNFEDIKKALATGKLQQWLEANNSGAECEIILKIDLAATDADVQILKALHCPEEKLSAYQQKLREIAGQKAREQAALEAEARAKAELETRRKEQEAQKSSARKSHQSSAVGSAVDAAKLAFLPFLGGTATTGIAMGMFTAQEFMADTLGDIVNLRFRNRNASRKQPETDNLSAEEDQTLAETVQTTETPPQESSSAPLETVYWVKLKKIIQEETDMPKSIIRKNSSLSDVFELSAFDKQRLLKTVCRQFYIEDRTFDPEKINTVGDILDCIVGCTSDS